MSVDPAQGTAQVAVAGSHYRVRLSELTPESRTALQKAAGSAQEVDVEPLTALILVGDDTGITNTACREKRIESASILTMAAGSKSQDEFLLALGDALPQATFVYESRSLQQDRVSRMNPRVVRFSFDGKQMVTYVCDPRSKNYGTIEVMTWNESTSRYDFSHVSFKGKGERAESHVERNPESCTACHGAGDAAKPIWGKYPEWPGTYGANEDLMQDPSSEDRVAFQKFKEKYRDSTCLSTLPWPKEGSKMEIYPYVDRQFDLNFALRPNTRLTDRLSAQYSETLFSRVIQDPLWPVMQYYVFADFLECGSMYPWSSAEQSVPKRAEGWLPAMAAIPPVAPGVGFGSTLLTRFSRARGIEPDAWNLDLPVTDGSSNLRYNTGRGTLEEMVIGRAMAQAASRPETGMQAPFAGVNGPYFAKEGPVLGCEESTPDPSAVFSGNRSGACKAVMAKIDQLEQTQGEVCPMPAPALPEAIKSSSAELVAALARDAQDGRAILSRKCSSCHSGSSGLGFLANEEGLRKHLAGDGRFSSEGVLDAIRAGDMPPVGKALNADELRKVSAYIDSLTGN